MDQYGGVWARDEAHKSFGIASSNVIDEITLSVPFLSLAGKAPADSREIYAKLCDIVGKLAAQVSWTHWVSGRAASCRWQLCWLQGACR